MKQQERNSLQILVPRSAALFLRNCWAYRQDTEKVRLTVLSFLLLLPGSLTLNLGPKQSHHVGLLSYLSVFFYPFSCRPYVFHFPWVDASFLTQALILFVQTTSGPLWNKAS